MKLRLTPWIQKSLFFISLLVLTQCDIFEDERDAPVLNLTGITAPFPCEDGLSDGTFPCDNIDMFSHVPNDSLLGQQANDIWGWLDPETLKQYALVGLTDGVSIVDVTRPDSVIVVGKLNEPAFLNDSAATTQNKASPPPVLQDGDEVEDGKEASTWRDLKVFNNHVFVVSDGQPHALQVFDLTRVREITDPPVFFREDALYRRFGSAHNIAINEDTGFAYIVGTNGNTDECGSFSSLHMVDINEPLNPTLSGCYSDEQIGNIVRPGYVHDTQCVIYEGPDEDFNNREVCFNSSETNFSITDVEDKNNASTISFISYPGNEYAHQGWLTKNHRYFLLNDELDESRNGVSTSTHIFDVQDLQNPVHIGTFEHETFSIDHNLYIEDGFVYQSNYTSGLRVLETGNLENAELKQIGFFDTHPANNAVTFDGTWSNYPFFSNIVLVSDLSEGLFVLSPSVQP